MKISPEIESLKAYVPGKPLGETKRELGLDRIVKLASNENSLGPSPTVAQAIRNEVPNVFRYPDPKCYDLVTELAQRWNLDPSWIAVGNGSNELIDLLIRIFCEPGSSILTSSGAFIAYKVCAQAARVRTIEAPLSDDYRFNVEQLLTLSRTHQPRLVFLPNPNNPTGTYMGSTAIHRLMEEWGNRDDMLVVFDEAYLEYVRAVDYRSAMQLLTQYKNVVVLHTMSKVYGLAGCRVGFMYARPEVTELVHRVRNPFNVGSLAQVAALAALRDQQHVRTSIELVWRGLDDICAQLSRLKLSFVPSQANFVLFDTGHDGQRIFEELLRKGLVLRPVAAYGFPHHLRMTVGLPEENQFAMQAIEEVL